MKVHSFPKSCWHLCPKLAYQNNHDHYDWRQIKNGDRYTCKFYFFFRQNIMILAKVEAGEKTQMRSTLIPWKIPSISFEKNIFYLP